MSKSKRLIKLYFFLKTIHYNRLNITKDKTFLISINYNNNTLLKVFDSKDKTFILLFFKIFTLVFSIFVAMFKSHVKENLNNYSKLAKLSISLLDNNAKIIIVLYNVIYL